MNVSRNVLIDIDRSKLQQRIRSLMSNNILSNLNNQKKLKPKRSSEFATERYINIADNPYANSFKPPANLSTSVDSIKINRKLNAKYKQNEEILIEMQFLRKNQEILRFR